MIFRRIKAHVEKENWFAVFIDFAIVVFGVFIGIQVANWNDFQQDEVTNQLYLNRIADSIDTDTKRLRESLVIWKRDIDQAGQVEQFLTGKDAAGMNEWELLVETYFSAGWSSFRPETTTYDELIASGRFAGIGDLDLRGDIADYYSLLKETSLFYAFEPPLREMIRGKYDTKTQTYIWENCFSEELYRQARYGVTSCPQPDETKLIEQIVTRLRSDPELLEAFRFTRSIGLIAHSSAQEDIRRSSALAERIREHQK